MTNKLNLIVDAIVKQEGRPGTDTNPGDIRDPVWLPGLPPLVKQNGDEGFSLTSRRKYYDGTLVTYRLTDGGGSFWVPRTRTEGLVAIAHEVYLHGAECDTLTDFIAGSQHYAGFAPAADGNNTAAYIKNVAAAASVDPLVPMHTYLLN